MDLHRADRIPDYEKVPANKRTLIQKIAAKTKGIITPGNFLTASGIYLVIDGLYDFTHGNKWPGFLKMAAGGFADMADGKVANWTNTKSPLGEAFDATADKVKLAAGLAILGATDTVPMIPAVLVGVQNAANVAFTSIAKARGNEVHPDAVNKRNFAAQVAGLGGFVLADTLSPGLGHDLAEYAGWGLTVGSTLSMGVMATKHLAECALKPQQFPASE